VRQSNAGNAGMPEPAKKKEPRCDQRERCREAQAVLKPRAPPPDSRQALFGNADRMRSSVDLLGGGAAFAFSGLLHTGKIGAFRHRPGIFVPWRRAARPGKLGSSGPAGTTAVHLTVYALFWSWPSPLAVDEPTACRASVLTLCWNQRVLADFFDQMKTMRPAVARAQTCSTFEFLRCPADAIPPRRSSYVCGPPGNARRKVREIQALPITGED